MATRGIYLNGVDVEGRFAARHELAKRSESASRMQAAKATISLGRFARARKPEMVGIDAAWVERFEGMSLERWMARAVDGGLV